MSVSEDKYILDDIEIDDDDPINYEEVPDTLDDSDSEEEDMRATIRTLKQTGGPRQLASSDGPEPKVASDATVTVKPPVVDDFIRNFLIKNGMTETLASFQHEWYGLSKKLGPNSLVSQMEKVPDVYMQKAALEEKIRYQEHEMETMRKITEKAKNTWERLRKERDYHRMHHRRVVQEKNRLLKNMKRLKTHCERYEPTLKMLKHKYELAMKAKMLMRLEKDKIGVRLEAMGAQLKSIESMQTLPEPDDDPQEPEMQEERGVDSLLPADDRVNPYLNSEFDPTPVQNFTLRKTFPGHQMAVSGMALHPRKDILATTSDDTTWKMWAIPSGELIMSGDGHKDWVSSVDFHPGGTHLATCSGDGTVKLWDFVKSSCSATFADHSQAVWDLAFHDSGDFLVSCSMDQSAKLWDVNSERCRQTFRGHVDSINSVCFQPYSNNICTGSGDKTISFWDLRSGLCIQTFYGHHNAVNHVTFNLRADEIASCDADGVVKVWDVRMVAERQHLATGDMRHPANSVRFDSSGKRLVVASDDGTIKVYTLEESDSPHLGDLAGHEDAVSAILFGHDGKTLISGSHDNSFRIWQ